MLGRKTYTRDEIDDARSAFAAQISADEPLAGTAAYGDFEPLFFSNLVLVLDRYFVHRIRPVAGKEGGPLNGVELLTDSLLVNGGVFRTNKVIEYLPERSVLKLDAGDRIRLSRDDFDRLSSRFFAELEEKFLE